MKLSLENIRVVKFLRLEENPRKQQNYFALKISQYTVRSKLALDIANDN